jgi:hypothetical protein
MAAKDRNLLIVLLGVLLLVACFFGIYRPKIAENQTISAENQTLSARLDELNGMIEQQSFYEEEITRIENGIKQELAAFPSGLQYENGIMDVVSLEHFTNTEVPSLTVGEPAYVSVNGDASADSDSAADGAAVSSSAANQYSLYAVTTSITYSSSYSDTKSLIDMIAQNQDKRSMRSFSATYDATTGLLTGAIEFESYFIDGQDGKAYVPADIPSMSHGVDNIFGTIEYSEQEEGAAYSGEAQESAESEAGAGMQ